MLISLKEVFRRTDAMVGIPVKTDGNQKQIRSPFKADQKRVVPGYDDEYNWQQARPERTPDINKLVEPNSNWERYNNIVIEKKDRMGVSVPRYKIIPKKRNAVAQLISLYQINQSPDKPVPTQHSSPAMQQHSFPTKQAPTHIPLPCRQSIFRCIHWHRKVKIGFASCKIQNPGKKLAGTCIGGNPPYHPTTNHPYDKPVYFFNVITPSCASLVLETNTLLMVVSKYPLEAFTKTL